MKCWRRLCHRWRFIETELQVRYKRQCWIMQHVFHLMKLPLCILSNESSQFSHLVWKSSKIRVGPAQYRELSLKLPKFFFGNLHVYWMVVQFSVWKGQWHQLHLHMSQQFFVFLLREKNITQKACVKQKGAPLLWNREVRSFLGLTKPLHWIALGSSSVLWPVSKKSLNKLLQHQLNQ